MGRKIAVSGSNDGASTVDIAHDEKQAALLARRAYELWQARGCPEGDPMRDWFEAERLLVVERDAAATRADGRQ